MPAESPALVHLYTLIKVAPFGTEEHRELTRLICKAELKALIDAHGIGPVRDQLQAATAEVLKARPGNSIR